MGAIRHYLVVFVCLFVFFLTVYSGTAERIFNWRGGGGGRGLENDHRSGKFVGGSGGILPQKIVKSRTSEMAFSTLSMKYFFKKLNLDKV